MLTLSISGVKAQNTPDNSWKYDQQFRPQFHFSPERGWIGDPNGMIRYDDLYHVFWWGHATSEDLVHWQEQPYPMTGDNGSFLYFSGSVVVDLENSAGFADANADHPPMVAIYTMHDQFTQDEAQGLSVSQDHQTFVYYDQNPVLDIDQPVFRDPTVFFHEPTQRWIMAITLSELHRIQFYASDNLKDWEYLSEFGPLGSQAGWWEVPDLVELPVEGDPSATKWVLICGVGPNRIQYFVGDFDGTRFISDDPSGKVNWLDYGADYYAARTYRDYDQTEQAEQRTVLMAWMGNWQYANDVPTTWGKGNLALPREISLRTTDDGPKIIQQVIPALESLRGSRIAIDTHELQGRQPLTEFMPPRNTYELELTFEILDPEARFGLQLAKNDELGLTVGYDAATSSLFIDRTQPENGDFSADFPKLMTAPLQPIDGEIRLRIFVDQSSVEVFANDGDVAMSALYFSNPDSTGIELFSENGKTLIKTFNAWELESIWGLKP
jgi:fructan beta-fructosidase